MIMKSLKEEKKDIKRMSWENKNKENKEKTAKIRIREGQEGMKIKSKIRKKCTKAKKKMIIGQNIMREGTEINMINKSMKSKKKNINPIKES